jgi:YegS/Rv2252/BmrU family lipid kinase
LPHDLKKSSDARANRQPRRVTVIINPIAGGGRADPSRQAQLAVEVIERSGGIAEVFVTEHHGHASELAAGAIARGADVVAAWGGDGTINQVASALAFSDTPLAIVPSGSGNGLARELGISRRPSAALEQIVTGTSRRIDVGEIAGRLFVNVAGIGFDAHIAREFSTSRQRGLARYAWLTLAHLGNYRARTYSIDAAGRHRTVPALFICIANSRQFGNGAIIAPRARLDDGLLNLVVVGSRPAWRTIGAMPSLFRGRIDTVPDVWTFETTDGQVTGEAPLLFHVDGEPVQGGPLLTLRVHPGALVVRLPRSAGGPGSLTGRTDASN